MGKRRALCLILAAGLAALLWGCGSSRAEPALPEPVTSVEPEPPAPETPEPEPEAETPGPEPEEPEAEPEPEKSPVEELLSSLTLHEKICQLFLVTPEQLTGVDRATAAGETTRQALEDYPVGGLIYFADNLRTREQVTEMLANTQSFAPIGLFLAVDEEGGAVARVAKNPEMDVPAFPPMLTVGADGTDAACEVGRTIGGYLAELGFNLDFAPVADVYTNPENTVIGDRAFSTDPAEAAELVAAAVEGFKNSGILCTLKHFPGHGDTAADSHTGAAFSQRTLEELREAEFLPFRSGIDAGAPVVMTGHISLPAVTGTDVPASLSPEIVTGLLREELGFEGLCVTDSLQMAAVTDFYSPGEAAVLALQAGNDLILMPEDFAAAYQGVLEAVESGELTEARIDESVARILRVKLEQGILSPDEPLR